MPKVIPNNFFLDYDEIGEIMCPYCHTIYNPEWNTEYGDPIDGHYSIECDCGKTFYVDVHTTTDYIVRKN